MCCARGLWQAAASDRWLVDLVPWECLALTLAVFGECVGHAWWPVPCLLGLIIHVLPLGLDRFLSCLWFHWTELSPVDRGQSISLALKLCCWCGL